jgi:hypothetical protein
MEKQGIASAAAMELGLSNPRDSKCFLPVFTARSDRWNGPAAHKGKLAWLQNNATN